MHGLRGAAHDGSWWGHWRDWLVERAPVRLALASAATRPFMAIRRKQMRPAFTFQ